MKDKFHNPYHFVPVVDDPVKSTWQLKERFFDDSKEEKCHWSHKKYVDCDVEGKPVYHGRIMCRMVTDTPIFIGAERTEGSEEAPAIATPFEIKGKPAIPASSLRGVISSIAEAASNSSLRALEDDMLKNKKKPIDTVFNFFSAKMHRNETKGEALYTQDRDVLPFHFNRRKISPAEMVFGFVEDRKKDEDTKKPEQKRSALAYAGRLRFSHGIFEPERGKDDINPYLEEVTLKLLGTPKPPSPALYFTQKSGSPGYISKARLKIAAHKPQGRKFYLHHQEKEVNSKCWKTYYDEEFFQENSDKDKKNLGRFKQKSKIKPLKDNLSFYFHVDFSNLNEYELGMLLYALKPNSEFQHKIGMGKPLGLGSVSIDLIALHLIDRKQRYTTKDFFEQPRYSESLILKSEIWEKRPDQYLKEKAAPSGAFSYTQVLNSFVSAMQPDIKYALEAIGNRANVKYGVHTPLQISQTGENEEIDSYRWFVRNDKAKDSQRQCLRPIERPTGETDDSYETLPPLQRN